MYDIREFKNSSRTGKPRIKLVQLRADGVTIRSKQFTTEPTARQLLDFMAVAITRIIGTAERLPDHLL